MKKILDFLSDKEIIKINEIKSSNNEDIQFLIRCIAILEDRLSTAENDSRKWNTAWHEQRVVTGQVYWEAVKKSNI
jgi:hypothetical protein